MTRVRMRDDVRHGYAQLAKGQVYEVSETEARYFAGLGWADVEDVAAVSPVLVRPGKAGGAGRELAGGGRENPTDTVVTVGGEDHRVWAEDVVRHHVVVDQTGLTRQEIAHEFGERGLRMTGRELRLAGLQTRALPDPPRPVDASDGEG